MPPARAAAPHIALLRGINVGGKNKLPMQALVELFRRAGCQDVRTYIQSGNVLFRAPAAQLPKLPGLLQSAIAVAHGLTVPVLLRSAAELARAARANPFLRRGEDPAHLHIAFLADRPSPAALRSLDPDRSPPDEFAAVGNHIYLFLPNGVAHTKLGNAYLDARLGTTCTVRNWRTVTMLLELAEQA